MLEVGSNADVRCGLEYHLQKEREEVRRRHCTDAIVVHPPGSRIRDKVGLEGA